jgi:hypothetical protein
MTLADHLSEDDLLLLTEPEPDRNEPPAGAETMARPWRLGIVGVGITIGLVTRLLAANGYFSINSRTLVYAAAITSLLAGIGLITLAAERDRFDRWMVLLAAGTGLSLGALQWVSPNFSSGTLEWSNATQVALALLGIGNGVLLAGILTLAFVRRWPTMTVVGVLAAGVLTLAAGSALLRSEWPAIAALALAFGGILLAWDQAPRHEPTYPLQAEAPRIARAALSLAIVALGGSVVQLWVSRGEAVRRMLPAAVLTIVLIVLAFLAMIRIRRELQRRETSLNEWTSWMREIRTGDLQSDFENLGTTDSGAVIGDVTGEAPRPLSFPDLHVEEELPQPEAIPAEAAGAEEEPVVATASTTPPLAPAIDVPSVLVAPAIPLPDVAAPAIPVADVPVDAAQSQPALFGDVPPAAAEVVWAEDLGDSLADDPALVPRIGDEQRSLFDFEHEVDTADLGPPPTHELAAPTFSGYLDVDPEPADIQADPAAPAEASDPVTTAEPALATGAFSSWLGDDAELAAATGTIDDLAAWLRTHPLGDATRLVAAIETMSLADFDELPAEVSSSATAAMMDRLGLVAPSPQLVATVDGPYLLVAWDALGHHRFVEINRVLLDAMSTPVETEHGAVALTGTLALLQPGDGATIDEVIDQAIQGLVQARQLEADAAEAR